MRLPFKCVNQVKLVNVFSPRWMSLIQSIDRIKRWDKIESFSLPAGLRAGTLIFTRLSSQTRTQTQTGTVSLAVLGFQPANCLSWTSQPPKLHESIP